MAWMIILRMLRVVPWIPPGWERTLLEARPGFTSIQPQAFFAVSHLPAGRCRDGGNCSGAFQCVIAISIGRHARESLLGPSCLQPQAEHDFSACNFKFGALVYSVVVHESKILADYRRTSVRQVDPLADDW